MPPAGFEPTIPASEPPTHAIDRAAAGIGSEHYREHKFTLGKIQTLIFEVDCMCSYTCTFTDQSSHYVG